VKRRDDTDETIAASLIWNLGHRIMAHRARPPPICAHCVLSQPMDALHHGDVRSRRQRSVSSKRGMP
jgi:hypothetical protein